MKRDWTFCDGEGRLDRQASPPPTTNVLPDGVSRRRALALGGLGILGLLGLKRSALGQVSLSRDAEERDLLVVVFLRGGADGLNMVPPHAEDDYYRLRPNLALASPKRASASPAERAVDLDGFFGLHPALGPLLPDYREGRMAVVHAVGSADQSRSHFEAMSAMERGLPNAISGAASGWLARYLTDSQVAGDSPLRAVAIGPMLPDSLRGGLGGSAIQSVSDFKLSGPGAQRLASLLKVAYAEGKDEAQRAGRDTLRILESLSKLDPGAYGGAAGYPASELGEGLKQVAMLAKAGVGLEVACLDKGGWDTHIAQGVASGWLAGLLQDVAASLQAFQKDMGPRMKRTTVVVMTEFGRRAYENTGLGTDHGRASVMLLLGGGVRGGKVFSDWPGLAQDRLEDGDLRVTTDYRSVLAEVLERRMAHMGAEALFEGLRPGGIGALS
jgi:uncharacterized protein (DUF1501 family)